MVIFGWAVKSPQWQIKFVCERKTVWHQLWSNIITGVRDDNSDELFLHIWHIWLFSEISLKFFIRFENFFKPFYNSLQKWKFWSWFCKTYKFKYFLSTSGRYRKHFSKYSSKYLLQLFCLKLSKILAFPVKQILDRIDFDPIRSSFLNLAQLTTSYLF